MIIQGLYLNHYESCIYIYMNEFIFVCDHSRYICTSLPLLTYQTLLWWIIWSRYQSHISITIFMFILVYYCIFVYKKQVRVLSYFYLLSMLVALVNLFTPCIYSLSSQVTQPIFPKFPPLSNNDPPNNHMWCISQPHL